MKILYGGISASLLPNNCDCLCTITDNGELFCMFVCLHSSACVRVCVNSQLMQCLSKSLSGCKHSRCRAPPSIMEGDQ